MTGAIAPILLGALCLGLLTGLRALTPITVLIWAVHLQHLSVAGTWLSFLDTKVALVVATLLALLELISDKLPSTPSRLKPPGLIGRVGTGFLSGCVWMLAAGEHAWWIGAIVAFIGAPIGAFLGHAARTGLVRVQHFPDFPIALLEDAVAIGGSIFIVAQFCR